MKKICTQWRLFALLTLLLACEKVDPQQEMYGCLYGVPRGSTTGKEVYIMCIHNELYGAGDNQVAANTLADDLKIPRINVGYMKNYTNRRWVQNPKCDCE